MSDTSFAQYCHYGTNAQRLAFTPAPGGGQPIYLWYTTDTNTLYAYDTAWHLIVSSASGDVVGPASVTDSRVVLFDGTTGKLIKQAAAQTGSGAPVFATSPVLVTPNIGTPSAGNIAACTAYPASSLATISSLYINLQDHEISGTSGGTFTTGAWRTRILNTEVNDVGGLCSLASNQFTLSAGTYIIDAIAPGYNCNGHQLRLQNITDTATILTGQSAFSRTGASASQYPASLKGMFTIGASKALELQHSCETTSTTLGFGVAASQGTEVYAVVELWKIG